MKTYLKLTSKTKFFDISPYIFQPASYKLQVPLTILPNHNHRYSRKMICRAWAWSLLMENLVECFRMFLCITVKPFYVHFPEQVNSFNIASKLLKIVVIVWCFSFAITVKSLYRKSSAVSYLLIKHLLPMLPVVEVP